MCKILDLKTLFEEKGKAKDHFTFRMLFQNLRKAISKFNKSYQIKSSVYLHLHIFMNQLLVCSSLSKTNKGFYKIFVEYFNFQQNQRTLATFWSRLRYSGLQKKKKILSHFKNFLYFKFH